EYRPPRGGLAGEEAFARLVVVLQRQAANRHLEILDDLFHGGIFIAEITAGEAPVNLRLVGVFRREVRPGLGQVPDVARVLGAHFQRPLVQPGLHILEDLANGRDKLRPADARLFTRVAAGKEDGVLFDVARADFRPQRDAALDVLPVLLAAAQLAVVE